LQWEEIERLPASTIVGLFKNPFKQQTYILAATKTNQLIA